MNRGLRSCGRWFRLMKRSHVVGYKCVNGNDVTFFDPEKTEGRTEYYLAGQTTPIDSDDEYLLVDPPAWMA